MKILVTGSSGQLGNDVIKELRKFNKLNVIGVSSKDFDITNSFATKKYISKLKPNIIIHCAAFTDVDKAEENKKKCYDVNVNGTKHLIKFAKKFNAKFIYISTDYVFSGDKKEEYNISDKTNPKTYYGKTKLLGELETLKYKKSFIVRVSWLFGSNGKNFITKMLELSSKVSKISVIEDQIGSPTYTRDVAKFIKVLLDTEKFGVYQVSNTGSCSWYEFAEKIFVYSKKKVKLLPIKSEDFNSKANRPKYSVMNKKNMIINGFKLLPDWKNALKRYLKEIEVIA